MWSVFIVVNLATAWGEKVLIFHLNNNNKKASLRWSSVFAL